MLKRISWIGLAVLIGIGSISHYCSDSALAGPYKLEYPPGWGTCCPANSLEYGYTRTQWREWPGEIRRDKTFPRSIGMERIPTPAGQEIIPPPKAIRPSKVPSELQPGPGEGMLPPSEGLPTPETPDTKPTEPGMGIPTLPGLPQDPGGFNPLPGLPQDFGTPSPLNPNEEKKNSVPAIEPNKDRKPTSDSQDKTKIEIPGSGTKLKINSAEKKLQANVINGNRLEVVMQQPQTTEASTEQITMLQPSIFGDVVGATPKYSSNMARNATYHEPAESSMTARLSRDVVSQTYEQANSAEEASAVVQSGLQSDLPVNEPSSAALPVALDGFCPVELSLHNRWTQGDPRWSVTHKGITYHLSGNNQRQEFLSNPEKYKLVNNGIDLVILATENRNVAGQINYCAAYKGRIYMFSSAKTQEYFQKNPELYINGATK
jgi:YHS domain-containing protein